MIDPKIVRLLEHPLAGFAIAFALCLYHPFVIRVGGRIFRTWFNEPLADGGFMKQVRMLGSELSTISVAAMLKAAFDPNSDLSHAISHSHIERLMAFYGWLGLLYVSLVFTPSVFVRYALLERDRGPNETNRDWSLFLWRWSLVSWLLGFVNLHIALKFAVH